MSKSGAGWVIVAGFLLFSFTLFTDEATANTSTNPIFLFLGANLDLFLIGLVFSFLALGLIKLWDDYRL